MDPSRGLLGMAAARSMAWDGGCVQPAAGRALLHLKFNTSSNYSIAPNPEADSWSPASGGR